MTDTKWVRIADSTCQRTVPADAVPDGARILANHPAADPQGRPLPTKPRTDNTAKTDTPKKEK